MVAAETKGLSPLWREEDSHGNALDGELLGNFKRVQLPQMAPAALHWGRKNLFGISVQQQCSQCFKRREER